MARKHFGIVEYNGSQSRRIHLIKSQNPKRPGTYAAARYAQYRNGMTDGEYFQACRRLSVPNYSRADITWDFEHGFIKLED
jgi:hypothetical protein